MDRSPRTELDPYFAGLAPDPCAPDLAPVLAAERSAGSGRVAGVAVLGWARISIIELVASVELLHDWFAKRAD